MASEQENRIVAEVMDNMKMAETEESSARRYVRRAVTRGDTTISYRDPSASRSATVDFMKNYETSLNHYKKMRLPKDNYAGS